MYSWGFDWRIHYLMADNLRPVKILKMIIQNLFPTAYIGYSPNDKNQFVINYGRRIERPDYSDLNPFYYFIDKYTYEVGNPKCRTVQQ